MTEKKSEQMVSKNLTNLVKNIDMHIQQVQQNPSRIHTKKFTHTHHSQTAESQCLSITNSWSSPKLMSIGSVMPSSHLILCRPLLLLPPIPPSIRVFSNESLAFSVIQQMLAIWSLVPLPLLKPAWTSGSSWFTYCWSLTWRILSITFLACEIECNCVVVWAFFGTAFLWDWNENWPFPVLWALLFSKFAGILSAALSQRHLSGFERAQLEFHHLH